MRELYYIHVLELNEPLRRKKLWGEWLTGHLLGPALLTGATSVGARNSMKPQEE